MIINYNKYEELKDKISSNEVKKAIGNLMLVDYGNSHIFTKNIDNLSNLTDESVFAYNNALLKDMTKSYDLVLTSIRVLYNTGYKDLISKEPTLIGKDIEILSYETDEKNYEIDIFSKEEYEFIISSLPSEYTHSTKNGFTFDVYDSYYDTKKIYKNKDDEVKFLGRKNDDNPLLNEKKIFNNKKSMIINTKVPLILDGCAKYSAYRSSSALSVSGGNAVKIQSLLKRDFIDNFLKEKADISLVDFIKITKRVEQFTLGYYLDQTYFKPTEKSRTKYVNYEYRNEISKGREIYEDFQNTYFRCVSILQGAVDSNREFDATMNILMGQLQKSLFLGKAFLNQFIILADQLNDDSKTLKNLSKIFNASYDGTITMLSKTSRERADKLEYIRYGESSDIKDEKKLYSFLEKVRVLKYNVDIHNKIFQQSGIDEENTNNILSNENIKEAIKNFMIHNRATLFDNKIDSYVLNFREEKREDEQELSDNAVLLAGNNPNFAKVVKKLQKCKFHDYFEIDAEFIKNDGIEYLDKFADALQTINIPVHRKTALKWRKLGNYRAAGIYFQHASLIGEDFRSLRSYIHELTHHIDISENLGKLGRGNLVNLLSSYFDSRIEEKRDYYLSDVELIARAGEVAYVLELGGFEELLKQFKDKEINSEQLLEKLYENFNNNPYSFLMEKITTYKGNPVYIDIDEVVKSNNLEMLEIIQEYYKPFYSNNESNVKKILESSFVSGYTNRKIEGLSPNSTFRREADFKVPSSFETILPHEIVDIDFSTVGTKEDISLEDLLEKDEVTPQDIERLRVEKDVSDADIVATIPYKVISDKTLSELLKVPDLTLLREVRDAIKAGKIDKQDVTVYLEEYIQAFHFETAIHQDFLDFYLEDIKNSTDTEYLNQIGKIFFMEEIADFQLKLKDNNNFTTKEKSQFLLNFLSTIPDEDISKSQKNTLLDNIILSNSIETLKEINFPKCDIEKILSWGGSNDEDFKKLPLSEKLSKYASVIKEINHEEIPLEKKYKIIRSLWDDTNVDDAKGVVLDSSMIEHVNSIKLGYQQSKLIKLFSYCNILNKEQTAYLTTEEKIDEILKQDGAEKWIVSDQFLNKALLEKDFASFEQLIKYFSKVDGADENGVLHACLELPIFQGKDKTGNSNSDDSFVGKTQLFVPADFLHADEEKFKEIIQEIKHITIDKMAIVETTKLLAKNNQSDKLISFMNEFSKTNENTNAITLSIIPILREYNSEKLILDDVQLGAIKKIMRENYHFNNFVVKDVRDDNKLYSFAFDKETGEDSYIFDKFIDYLKHNTDEDILDNFKKYERIRDFVKVDLKNDEHLFVFNRKTYTEESLAETAAIMLTGSDITNNTLSHFKSNRKVFNEDLIGKIKYFREGQPFILSPRDVRKICTKENLLELIQKADKWKKVVNVSQRSGAEAYENLLNRMISNNKLLLSDTPLVSKNDINEILHEDSNSELHHLASKSIVILNSLKSYFESKGNSNFSDICDSIGNKMYYETARTRYTNYSEETDMDSTIDTVNKGVGLIKSIIEGVKDDIPLVYNSERTKKLVEEILEEQKLQETSGQHQNQSLDNNMNIRT